MLAHKVRSDWEAVQRMSRPRASAAPIKWPFAEIAVTITSITWSRRPRTYMLTVPAFINRCPLAHHELVLRSRLKTLSRELEACSTLSAVPMHGVQDDKRKDEQICRCT